MAPFSIGIKNNKNNTSGGLFYFLICCISHNQALEISRNFGFTKVLHETYRDSIHQRLHCMGQYCNGGLRLTHNEGVSDRLIGLVHYYRNNPAVRISK